MMFEIDFIFRLIHLMSGITWIGMLYYFNFVQGGYFKSATPEALADAKTKLAPNALWWFRWGAMFTFFSGLYLFKTLGATVGANDFIMLGALMGTLMFLNVWIIIWPAQRIALGMKEGDGPKAAARALLASRTNTLFSGPMAYFMLASAHKKASATGVDTGLLIGIAIVALLEINAIVGKQGPLTTVKGVIFSSIALTAILSLILHYI